MFFFLEFQAMTLKSKTKTTIFAHSSAHFKLRSEHISSITEKKENKLEIYI